MRNNASPTRNELRGSIISCANLKAAARGEGHAWPDMCPRTASASRAEGFDEIIAENY